MRSFIEPALVQHGFKGNPVITQVVLQCEKLANVNGAVIFKASGYRVINNVGNISSYDLPSQLSRVHRVTFTVSDINACTSRTDDIARNTTRPRVAKQNNWHRKSLRTFRSTRKHIPCFMRARYLKLHDSVKSRVEDVTKRNSTHSEPVQRILRNRDHKMRASNVEQIFQAINGRDGFVYIR